MKRVGLLTGLAIAAMLTACGLDHPSATEPVSSERAVTLVRGASIAQAVCAQCHGVDLEGAVTETFTSPSLRVVRDFTFSQFTTMLDDGIGRGGVELDPRMATARALDVFDRSAVFAYLSTRYDQ